MLILTTSASLPFLLHDSYNNGDDIRRVVAYLGLYLIALGAGGIKPCMSALGADQFDGADPVERVTKGSFFNYYYFSNNMGTLLSTTVLVWVQDNIGWGIGFATPMLLMGFGLSMFVAGRRVYRYRKLGRSPLTRVSQVVVAAARNHRLKLPDDSSLLHELPSLTEGGYRIQHTTRFRYYCSSYHQNICLVTAADINLKVHNLVISLYIFHHHSYDMSGILCNYV